MNSRTTLLALAVFASSAAFAQKPADTPQQPLLTGQAAFTDWAQQRPGVRHKITLGDLPAPNPAEAVDNGPNVVPRPITAWPIAPAGFSVTLYAGGDSKPLERAAATEHMKLSNGTFTQPRFIATAPNGDLFLADSGAGTIFVLRGVAPSGKAATIEKFATGLDHPFGIAFYPSGPNPQYVYVGNATTIQRFAYHNGDLQATGKPETIVPDIPGYAQLRGGGHWTRDVVFTKDDKYMLVSVGSGSNVDDADTHPREFHRADILEYTPEGKFIEVYANGLRNCVGEAINPVTGSLWCSTNERDNLGNHLVPDYVTSVPQGSFFGWPWYYMGGHQDPRLPQPCANGTGPNPGLSKPLTDAEAKDCKRVDMSSKVQHAGRPRPAAHGLAGDELLSRLPRQDQAARSLPRVVLRRSLRGRARQLEPRQPRRLRGHLHPDEGRPRHRRVRRLPHRLRHPRRPGLGPPRRRHGRQGRQPLRHRRRQPLGLAHHPPQQVTRNAARTTATA